MQGLFFPVIIREMAKWKILFLVLRLQSRALWGFQAQRPFWFPFLIGRTAASMTFCESKGRTDADQRRMLTPGQSCPTLLWPSGHKIGCHFFLQGVFPTQESNPSLLYWQVDSLPLQIRTPDHLRPCTQLHLVTNPILLQLCRGNKNTRLLLPWSLAYIPSGWYNISLLTREGA